MFAKLFQSMYDGSLGTRGPWEALVTFQQLLILSDRFGDVDMTIEVIARRTIIPEEIIRKGIEELSKPDPHSRDPHEEGRRIVPISDTRDWGWHIVNYTKYAQIRSAEERREYKRQWYAAHRKSEQAKPAITEADTGEVIEHIPMIGGTEFEVRQSFVAELERLYPAVDIPATLRQMRGWCLGNPAKLKTPRGIRRFITGWCDRDQNRG